MTFDRIMSGAVKAFEVLGVLILIVGGFMALIGCIVELARGTAPSRASMTSARVSAVRSCSAWRSWSSRTSSAPSS